MDATYNFTFVVTADMPRQTVELIEDAEDSRAFPLSHIEAECRRLGCGAKLYGASGYCGVMEEDGNVVFG